MTLPPDARALTNVNRPRCSKNIRIAGWTTLILLNLAWVGCLYSVIGDPRSNSQPGVREVFATFWIAFGIASIVLTIRAVRVAVWIDGGAIRVRSYAHNYSVPVADAVRFSYGYPDARIPSFDLSGSLELRDGTRRPVVAISRGILGASAPAPRVGDLLTDLNAALEAINGAPDTRAS